ncbi:hypothetical protein [Filimonas effusa]|uniref:hypothetical protein n=1 Tax=Filimonas effusa TaxID=2508721 RepID=UPI0013E977BA|nr:hypothetical protein [Filimonas effusa]
MKYVLSKNNQEIFLNSVLGQTLCDDKEISELVEGCKYFYHEVHGNSYFLSKSNETNIRKNGVSKQFITSVFSLANESNFAIEEMTVDFIEFLISQPSNAEVSLDEEIHSVHQNYLERYE